MTRRYPRRLTAGKPVRPKWARDEKAAALARLAKTRWADPIWGRALWRWPALVYAYMLRQFRDFLEAKRRSYAAILRQALAQTEPVPASKVFPLAFDPVKRRQFAARAMHMQIRAMTT